MEHESLDDVFTRIGFGKFHFILILIFGMLHSFDSMEMLILALIQPIFRCVWQISLFEESFIMTAVFLGMILSSPIIGRCCDLYGRKKMILIVSFFLGYLGLLSAGSPTIVWIITIRLFMGGAIGGIMTALYTIVSELMPSDYRSDAFMVMLGFWALGSYVIAILCIVIVPTLGWRMFLVISTLPIVIIIPCLLWVPESPRFLLLRNRKQEAIMVLNRIARFNKAEPVSDVTHPLSVETSFSDVFHRNYLFTTIICSLSWFAAGITYYGIVMIVTVIDNTPRQCWINWGTNLQQQTNNFTSAVDDSCCHAITWSSSVNIFISTTGELVFLPLTIILLRVIGRRYTLMIYTLTIAILFVLLNFCMPKIAMSAILFITRGFIISRFNVNIIYTSEVFPTSIRSVSIGICNFSARVGAMLSSFIVNYIFSRYSFMYGTLIFAVINFVATFGILLLPYETKGQPLFQTADEFANGEHTKRKQ